MSFERLLSGPFFNWLRASLRTYFSYLLYLLSVNKTHPLASTVALRPLMLNPAAARCILCGDKPEKKRECVMCGGEVGDKKSCDKAGDKKAPHGTPERGRGRERHIGVAQALEGTKPVLAKYLNAEKKSS